MSVHNQEHQDLATQQLKLRCQILEIENWAATLRCNEYRKLLLSQHPSEPLNPEPEPVAPVGRVGQARAVRASARVSRGGLARSRQSASARSLYVCLVS